MTLQDQWEPHTRPSMSVGGHQVGGSTVVETHWALLGSAIKGRLLAELWESHLLIVFIWHFTLWSAESMTRVQCL